MTSPTTTIETGESRGREATMAITTSTFNIVCTCGCGELVEASDAGFTATSVEVASCSSRKALGMVSVTMRKSAAYAAVAPVTAGWQHRDGLVVLA